MYVCDLNWRANILSNFTNNLAFPAWFLTLFAGSFFSKMDETQTESKNTNKQTKHSHVVDQGIFLSSELLVFQCW